MQFACNDRRLKIASKQNSLWLKIFKKYEASKIQSIENAYFIGFGTRPYRFGNSLYAARPSGR
jgi:hypothetical protein